MKCWCRLLTTGVCSTRPLPHPTLPCALQKDAFAMLTASIIHDYRHPGVNNGFLMKTSHTIALRYNDESVLENFHVAEGFAVMATSK